MRMDDLIKLLNVFQSSLLKDESLTLWFDNKSIPNCWETKNCEQIKCPAYGKENIRCWHMHGTYCEHEANHNKKRDLGFVDKWSLCQNCDVYKSATKSEEEIVKETFNNIIFLINKLDKDDIGLLKVVKGHFKEIVNIYSLTAREGEILMLTLSRKSRKEMSQKLNISLETVKMHSRNLFKKIGVRTKLELLHKIKDELKIDERVGEEQIKGYDVSEIDLIVENSCDHFRKKSTQSRCPSQTCQSSIIKSKENLGSTNCNSDSDSDSDLK